MKYVFSLLLVITLLFSCDKDRPRRGLYYGEFYATDSTGTNFTRYDNAIDVSDPNENSVTINGSVLSKKGKTINGQMGFTPAFNNSPGLNLNGKWKVRNGDYVIDGEFNTLGSSIVFGTFKLGSY